MLVSSKERGLWGSVAIYPGHKALGPGKCPHIYQGLRPLSSTELGPFIPSDMLYLAVWVSLMAQVTSVRTANFHTADHGTTWDSLKRTHPRLFAPTARYADPKYRGARAARGAGSQGGQPRAAPRGKKTGRRAALPALDTLGTAAMYRSSPNISTPFSAIWPDTRDSQLLTTRSS